jgi:uncharacterized membrane protein YkoI
MKPIWLSVLVLGLAACSAPAEKPAPQAKAVKTKSVTKVDKQAMAGTGAPAKKKAMPASKIAGVSATALAKAIETALQKVPGGEALAAEIEIENGKAMIDVKVFAHGKLYEVEINAATGAVQEVDQEDDDDDDDEDDDDGDGDDD